MRGAAGRWLCRGLDRRLTRHQAVHAIDKRGVAGPQVGVRHPKGPGEQREREAIGVEVFVAVRVLEPVGRAARGTLKALHRRAPRRFIGVQGPVEPVVRGHSIGQREGIVQREACA